METIELLADGTKRILRDPSKAIRQLPSYGKWKQFLEGRPEMGYLDEERTGDVKFVCICCGLGHSKMDMAPITIGTRIKLQKEEETGDKEVTISWRSQPVMKKGLGCPVCQGKMFDTTVRINQENLKRSELAKLQAQLAQFKMVMSSGYHQATVKELNKHKVKLPVPLEPFIDVFDIGEANAEG